MHQPFFKTELTVRFNDINIANHVDYAALLQMAGNTRALFFKKNNLNEMDLDGVGIMLKSMQVEYLSETNFNDVLEFSWYLVEIGKISLSVSIDVYNVTTKQAVAKIQKKFVFFNYQQKKLAKVPEVLIKLLG
jgi:acyl-CoA thioester hydrolase